MNSSCSPAVSAHSQSTNAARITLPVAIIGGGPVGIAAAARLLERGLEPVVLEAGATVGSAVRDWGHVRMFSPWRYNLDKACMALLEGHGWIAPDAEEFPTGRELAERYLEPLASSPELTGRLRMGTRVTAVTRAGLGKVKNAGRDQAPFEIRFEDTNGHEGRLLASAVVDASGTWGNPGRAGASGLTAIGERAASEHIRYGMPDVLGADRGRYAGRRTMVLGSGDSALGNLISLARLASDVPGTTIVWAARTKDLTRALGGGAADQLPERGVLGTRVRDLAARGVLDIMKPFAVHEVARTPDGTLLVTGTSNTGIQTVAVNEMIVATGFRPDLSILDEVRLDLDPALGCPRVLAPLIDPNLHSCGTVRPHGAAELQQPETGLFIVGMKSYGRAPTFLLATGYEQVRSVAAFLARDIEASRRVELDLPQTGVCSSNLVMDDIACCGGPAPAQEAACCVQDAEAKQTGATGCGCSDPVRRAVEAVA